MTTPPVRLPVSLACVAIWSWQFILRVWLLPWQEGKKRTLSNKNPRYKPRDVKSRLCVFFERLLLFSSSFLSPCVAVIQKPTCYVQMSNWFYLSETKCYEHGSPERERFGFIEIEHVVRVIWIYTLIAFCYISFEEYTRDTYRIQDTHWRGGWRAHTHTHTHRAPQIRMLLLHYSWRS